MLIDDFKKRFPEFEGQDVDDNWKYVAPAWSYYYSCSYVPNTRKGEAILNIIAHLLTLQLKSNQSKGVTPVFKAGVLTSKSVGGLSLGYAVPQNLSNDERYMMFSSTPYGQRFWMLTRQVFGAMVV